jgi:hypothetical protein
VPGSVGSHRRQRTPCHYLDAVVGISEGLADAVGRAGCPGWRWSSLTALPSGPNASSTPSSHLFSSPTEQRQPEPEANLVTGSEGFGGKHCAPTGGPSLSTDRLSTTEGSTSSALMCNVLKRIVGGMRDRDSEPAFRSPEDVTPWAR